MSTLSIQIGIANPTHEILIDDIQEMFLDKFRNGEVYIRNPNTKGFSAGAVDLIILLSAIGSVASIASILWQIYDRTIGMKKKSNSDSGLYIIIDTRFELTWWLGKDYKSEFDFLSDFIPKINEYLESEYASNKFKEIKEESLSRGWIRLGQ